MRNTILAALAAAAACAVAADALALDEPLGPGFGNTRYSTVLADPDGLPDVDTYVSELIAGETLDVAVAAAKGMSVEVSVTGPDGVERTPALRVAQGGRKVSFRKLAVDASGVWAVTVRQANDVTGPYSITFKLGAAPPLKAKKLSAGANSPASVQRFQAIDGARVDIRARAARADATVAIVGSTQPNGRNIQGLAEAAVVKKTKLTVSGYPLFGGAGEYSVTFRSEAASALYSVQIRVTPPTRPGKKGALATDEPRIAAPAAPRRVAAGSLVRIDGSGFFESDEAQPRVTVGSAPATVDAVASDGTWIDIFVPDVAAGVRGVTVQNPDGQAHERAGVFELVPPPSIADVKNESGQTVRTVSTLGGVVLLLEGGGLGGVVSVDLSSAPVEILAVENVARLRVRTPALPPGDYVFHVTDEFGRTATAPFSVHVPKRGFGEGDGGRLPAATAADDWSAARVALGDLDGSGDRESLVIASPLHASAYGFARHGTRDAFTRVLRTSLSSAFADTTSSKLPAAFAADFPFDTDDWNASALALGDLDGSGGEELVLGGFADTGIDGGTAGTLYGTNYNAAGVRVLSNVAGRFVLDPDIQPLPFDRRPPVVAVDEGDVEHELFGRPIIDLSGRSAIAIGDVDGDGDDDIVVARDEFEIRRVHLDIGDIDFDTSPPSISAADAAAFVEPPYEVYAYLSATTVIDNRLDAEGDFAYVPLALPFSVGGSTTGFRGTDAPGLHAGDIALVDIDGDDDLDLVLAWNDPTTVSVAGRKEQLDRRFGGDVVAYSSAPPLVATRVLLNDGSGHFADTTDDWMPAGGRDEWWQADRVLAVNVVGDARPDLVLGLDASLDGFRATSLTPLATTFTGAGNAAEIDAAGGTDTYDVSVPSTGRLVVRTRLGTLPDSVVSVFGPNSGSALAGRDDDGLGKASRVDIPVVSGTYTVQVQAFAGDQTGTYELEVGFLAASAPTPAHAAHALRILENRGADEGFVDVTADVLPALPGVGDEDFRCGAIAVADMDLDGRKDIVFASAGAVFGQSRVSSLRLFLGQPDGTFAQTLDLLPDVTVDSGEAQSLVLVGGSALRSPSLLLATKIRPHASAGGRFTRLLDWNR